MRLLVRHLSPNHLRVPISEFSKKFGSTVKLGIKELIIKEKTGFKELSFLSSNWNLDKKFVLTGELGQVHMAQKKFPFSFMREGETGRGKDH